MPTLSPKLRTVEKSKAAYALNKFPSEFAYKLGQWLTFIQATKFSSETVDVSLVGEEWEQIFSDCIDGDWTPSNNGLDDVRKGNTAWGAKTVKGSINAKQVRLISGRNALYSAFDEMGVSGKSDPNVVGELVLSIWNERVSAIRLTHKHLRTVVLIKGKALKEVAVFEFNTVLHDPELYYWEKNSRGNIQGYHKKTKEHKFTFQPGGAQFTIKEDVPEERLIVKVKGTKRIPLNFVLEKVGFKKQDVTIIRNGSGDEDDE